MRNSKGSTAPQQMLRDAKETENGITGDDPVVSVKFVTPTINGAGEGETHRLLQLLAECLRRYVAARPDLFDIQESSTPAGRIQTITRAKG